MILTRPVYIVDIIASVVSRVQTEILSTIQQNEINLFGNTGIQSIDYQYGHKRELIQTLAQYDADPVLKYNKYPLIYLVTDIREHRGSQPGVYADSRLNIIIAHHTDPNYKSAERKANVFIPVLYPIYYSLMKQLVTIPQTLQGNADMMEHDKWDRYYWGTQAIGGTDANTLNDYVDAIEIENLDVKFNYQPCLTPTGTK